MIPLFFTLSYFKSHAHVERDLGVTKSAICNYISTHTLTWSVTVTKPTDFKADKISTHTLTWSVTLSRSANR